MKKFTARFKFGERGGKKFCTFLLPKGYIYLKSGTKLKRGDYLLNKYTAPEQLLNENFEMPKIEDNEKFIREVYKLANIPISKYIVNYWMMRFNTDKKDIEFIDKTGMFNFITEEVKSTNKLILARNKKICWELSKADTGEIIPKNSTFFYIRKQKI